MGASTRESFARLVRLPPEYGYPPFQYIREYTRDGDRVLITGLTPLHVSSYTGRPMAGGQINWHRSWRSDSAGKQEALALLTVDRRRTPMRPWEPRGWPGFREDGALAAGPQG